MISKSGLSTILVGFTVDDMQVDTISERSAVLPVQTHNFARSLVRALNSVSIRVRLLSTIPVPNYPEYPFIVIRSGTTEQSGARGLTMGFVNLLVLKHVTRIYSSFTRGLRFTLRERPGVIMVHGVHTPFLIFALVAGKLVGAKTCLIMTDPPGVVRSVDGVVARALKRVDRLIVSILARRFDGIIALTRQLANDFAPLTECLVMEGFADTSLAEMSARPEASEFRIAYAGGLSEEYGVRNLVLAFKQIDKPDLRLDLYGRGPLVDWVERQSQADPRIRYHGAVAHGHLMYELRAARVLINPRPPGQSFLQYSFPSKLLEYMTLGVPVIATRIPGIPEEYFSYVETVDDGTVEALSSAITAVLEDETSAVRRASRAQAFVLEKKSERAQGVRIFEFLARLRGPSIAADD